MYFIFVLPASPQFDIIYVMRSPLANILTSAIVAGLVAFAVLQTLSPPRPIAPPPAPSIAMQNEEKAVGVAGGEEGNHIVVLYEMFSKGTPGGKCASITTRRFNFVNAGLKDSLLEISDKTGAFVLQKGTYFCQISAPAAIDGTHQIMLQDVTKTEESKTLLLGTPEPASALLSSRSLVQGSFTLKEPRALAVFHSCKGQNTGSRESELGIPGNQFSELYASLFCVRSSLPKSL